MRLFKQVRFLFLFLFPFLLSAYYVVFLQTELHESSTTILIKDLKSTGTPPDLMNVLIPVGASNMQDSKLLEKYIYSSDMFDKLNVKFELEKHYRSEALDMAQRLYEFSSPADLLNLYNKRLMIAYDEISATLDITFLHTDPKMAQSILFDIIAHAEHKLNMYDKENADELLAFISQQEKKNKRLLEASIQEVVAYQNSHKTIDPSMDIKAKSIIISELEATLVKKEMEHMSLKEYMNPTSIEVKTLRAEIGNLKAKLKELRAKLSGVGKSELNENLFEFETLKARVEFNKERYKQTLIQLDMAMIQSTQNAKNLIVITQPTLSGKYTYPDKVKNIITLLLVLLMIYGVVSMINAIIKDHRD